MQALFKFGTANTGFTKGVCTNDVVAQDSAVPEDKFGNKKIEAEDCCNHWTPKSKE